MIKTAGSQRLVRECMANYEYTDDKGETVIEEIRVKYFALTTADMKRQKAWIQDQAEADPNRIIWLAETLPFSVHSLPGVAGQDGKPIVSKFDKNGVPTKATVEHFENIARNNLEAIRDAISEDVRPKEQPSN